MTAKTEAQCLLEIDRLRGELAEYRAKVMLAWVIEKGSGSDLWYYAPTQPGEWTQDHLKACRFARKEDAEAIQFRHVERGHLPERGTRVCEHGWH